MSLSQNVRFIGDVPKDNEFDHPPGAALARVLRNALIEQGWQVSESDNWRDCGWEMTCRQGVWNIIVIITKLKGREEWIMQIAPSYHPGAIGRLMKKRASAPSEAVFQLARMTFTILQQQGFHTFRWRWDGFPDNSNSTAEPMPGSN